MDTPRVLDPVLGLPTVSVVIPAYRAAAYIAEAVGSVLRQTFQDFEVLVINDGSPDTDALERALRPFRDRIRYLRRENGGPSAARNHGIREACAEYVAFLDADDVWEPTFLQEQLTFLRANPDIDVVYADARHIGESARSGRTYMDTCPSTGEVTTESLLRGRSHVIMSGVVARKQPIIDVGMFDPEAKLAEDYDLWLRLTKAGGKVSYQHKVLLNRRIHESNLSGDPVRSREGALRVVQKLARRMDLTAREREAAEEMAARLRADAELSRGKIELVKGNFAGAIRGVVQANRFYRRPKLWAVEGGLKVAPGLVQRLYILRSRVWGDAPALRR